jgi:hypothetical protein
MNNIKKMKNLQVLSSIKEELEKISDELNQVKVNYYCMEAGIDID